MLQLMAQARAILRADDDGTVVSITEHDCGEPECGRGRTVILVMRDSRLNFPLSNTGSG